MNLLIVEDDLSSALAIQIKLESHVNHIVKKTSLESALKRISTDNFDLVILDYTLGNEKTAGLKIGNVLNEKSIPFIFITGHHTKEVFDQMLELKPLAYFEKPVDLTSLDFQIRSYSERITGQKEEFTISEDGYLFIKKNSKLHKLIINEIHLVEVRGNYISVMDKNQNKYLLRSSMKKFLNGFQSNQVIRVHRNFMVNINQVDSVDLQKKCLILGDREIPFGRVYKKDVMNHVKK